MLDLAGAFHTLDSFFFFRPVVKAFVSHVSQQEVDLTTSRHDGVSGTANFCTCQSFTSFFLTF